MGAFPKELRLRKRSQYLSVQRRGRRSHVDHFVVVSRRSGREITRLGTAVSKAVGNAVVRNRVKRRVREFFRLHRQAFPPAVDLVVIAKPGAGEISHAATRAELEQALTGDRSATR